MNGRENAKTNKRIVKIRSSSSKRSCRDLLVFVVGSLSSKNINEENWTLFLGCFFFKCSKIGNPMVANAANTNGAKKDIIDSTSDCGSFLCADLVQIYRINIDGYYSLMVHRY